MDKRFGEDAKNAATGDLGMCVGSGDICWTGIRGRRSIESSGR